MPKVPEEPKIIQHISYECSEFPDIKFKTPRDARLAVLAKELLRQTTRPEGSQMTTVDDLLFNIQKINSGDAKPIYTVSEEWVRCMRDDHSSTIYNNEDFIKYENN